MHSAGLCMDDSTTKKKRVGCLSWLFRRQIKPHVNSSATSKHSSSDGSCDDVTNNEDDGNSDDVTETPITSPSSVNNDNVPLPPRNVNKSIWWVRRFRSHGGSADALASRWSSTTLPVTETISCVDDAGSRPTFDSEDRQNDVTGRRQDAGERSGSMLLYAVPPVSGCVDDDDPMTSWHQRRAVGLSATLPVSTAAPMMMTTIMMMWMQGLNGGGSMSAGASAIDGQTEDGGRRSWTRTASATTVNDPYSRPRCVCSDCIALRKHRATYRSDFFYRHPRLSGADLTEETSFNERHLAATGDTLRDVTTDDGDAGGDYIVPVSASGPGPPAELQRPPRQARGRCNTAPYDEVPMPFPVHGGRTPYPPWPLTNATAYDVPLRLVRDRHAVYCNDSRPNHDNAARDPTGPFDFRQVRCGLGACGETDTLASFWTGRDDRRKIYYFRKTLPSMMTDSTSTCHALRAPGLDDFDVFGGDHRTEDTTASKTGDDRKSNESDAQLPSLTTVTTATVTVTDAASSANFVTVDARLRLTPISDKPVEHRSVSSSAATGNSFDDENNNEVDFGVDEIRREDENRRPTAVDQDVDDRPPHCPPRASTLASSTSMSETDRQNVENSASEKQLNGRHHHQHHQQHHHWPSRLIRQFPQPRIDADVIPTTIVGRRRDDDDDDAAASRMPRLRQPELRLADAHLLQMSPPVPSLSPPSAASATPLPLIGDQHRRHQFDAVWNLPPLPPAAGCLSGSDRWRHAASFRFKSATLPSSGERRSAAGAIPDESVVVRRVKKQRQRQTRSEDATWGFDTIFEGVQCRRRTLSNSNTN